MTEQGGKGKGKGKTKEVKHCKNTRHMRETGSYKMEEARSSQKKQEEASRKSRRLKLEASQNLEVRGFRVGTRSSKSEIRSSKLEDGRSTVHVRG